MALATVVDVEGSSYRRAGARMLVTEDGQLTGAISGGCLEGDALRKALLVINQQHNKLVTYDTNDEDDAKLGVQLGCNGVVHILFEPIEPENPFHPLNLLEELFAKRQEGVLITLFSLAHPQDPVPGTSVLILGDTVVSEYAFNEDFNEELFTEASHALVNKKSFTKEYLFEQQLLTAFVEFIRPPVSLLLAGAGNDAVPLVGMAHLLGWEVTLLDGRPTHANSLRFPLANRILVAKPEDWQNLVEIDEQTVVVLMTHNYNYDLAVLKHLLTQPVGTYIGSLGPKKKLERMLGDLKAAGLVPTAQQMNSIYGPVGLDLGAETAEEIALSIVAEIKKVLAGKSAGSLREKQEAIHHTSGATAVIDI